MKTIKLINMNTFKKGLLLLSTLLFAVGCNTSYNTIKISDVTKTDTVALVSKGKGSKIYKIEIIITGTINSDAIIYQKDKHTFKYPIELKKGDLNIELMGDWYSKECLLEYSPQDVTEGEILIKYKFYNF